MHRTAVALMLLFLCAAPALADVETIVVTTSDATPLTPADVDFYLSIKRAGAACITKSTGADKDAIDFMRKNRGLQPVSVTVRLKGTETPAEAADLRKSVAAVNAIASHDRQLRERASVLAKCDETIVAKRGQTARYRKIRDAVETAVLISASCGRDCDAIIRSQALLPPSRNKAAQSFIANIRLVKPYANEIRRLQKTMASVMGT
ncbi:MAG TPA: hypothetical protein VHZ78_06470 [Rhizomicrobium sp.]|nr:hypothetical protein [Rhizomicrobium sp.]